MCTVSIGISPCCRAFRLPVLACLTVVRSLLYCSFLDPPEICRGWSEPWILHHHLRWSAELAWWLLNTLINWIISRLLCWDAELYRLWDILFVFIQLVNSHEMWLFWLPRLYNKYSFVSSGRGPSLLISSFRFNFFKVCVMWMHVNAYMHVCVHVYTCTHMHKIPVRNHPPPLWHGLSVKPRACFCGPSP